MPTESKKNRRFIRITNKRKWKKNKKIKKDIERGKNTVINLSNKQLNNTEYRLLDKGLKFCPTPKPHYRLQLKQDVFEFTRKLRLHEYFAAKEENCNENENNTTNKYDNNSKKRNNSTFIPPSGRDSNLDF
jgi:hypothetical protein